LQANNNKNLSRDSKRLRFGLLKSTNALLNSASLEEGFNRVLKILGETTKVSRVYVYQHQVEENTREMYISLLYEWASEPAELQIDSSFKKISYSRFSLLKFYENFSKGQVLKFVIKDLPAELKNGFLDEKIKSTILIPIMVDKKYWGFIGFDEINNDRVWSEEEEAVLVKMASNLALSITKGDKKKFNEVNSGQKIKLINEQNILSFFADDKPGSDFFIELLDVYLKDLPSICKEIDRAISDEDYIHLKSYLHKLGGSLLNLGAKNVSEISNQLDQAAKENFKNKKVVELNMELQENIKKIIAEIKLLRKKYINFI